MRAWSCASAFCERRSPCTFAPCVPRCPRRGRLSSNSASNLVRHFILDALPWSRAGHMRGTRPRGVPCRAGAQSGLAPAAQSRRAGRRRPWAPPSGPEGAPARAGTSWSTTCCTLHIPSVSQYVYFQAILHSACSGSCALDGCTTTGVAARPRRRPACKSADCARPRPRPRASPAHAPAPLSTAPPARRRAVPPAAHPPPQSPGRPRARLADAASAARRRSGAL